MFFDYGEIMNIGMCGLSLIGVLLFVELFDVVLLFVMNLVVVEIVEWLVLVVVFVGMVGGM